MCFFFYASMHMHTYVEKPVLQTLFFFLFCCHYLTAHDSNKKCWLTVLINHSDFKDAMV